MAKWTVILFPVFAIIISLYAYFVGGPLCRMGSWIVPILGFIMLGMGITLSLHDFAMAFRKPKAVCIGLFLQYTVMPLLALGISYLLHFPKELIIGMAMVGVVAGGTASNVVSYLAGGDVALSITMTACSTIAGIFLTPLLAGFLLRATVDVPVWAMFRSILLMVALPVSLGLVLNRLLRNQKKIIEEVCPLLASIGIVLVIGVIVAQNRSAIDRSGALVFLGVFLHNAGGLLLGYLLSRLLRCDQRTAITIAIEVGMQNSGLAVALTKQYFGLAATLPGMIFSVWHNVSGAIFAGLTFFSRKRK